MTSSMGLVLLLALALLSGCGLHGKPKVARKARAVQESTQPAAPPESKPPPPAATAGTQEPQEPATVVAPGIVEPWGDRVALAAQESGWIAEIRVREGDVVGEGQVLAVLDDAPQRVALELARAELQVAEAALARIERGATPEELRQAQAQAQAAAAQSELARSAAGRTARLLAEKATADADAERAGLEARTAEARSAEAQARLSEVQRGARAEDRAAARAQVAAARARLALAETSLSRRRVVAPAAGTVLLSRLHAGELTSAGAGPMFVLGDMTRLQIRLEVDEIDAQDVVPGLPCTLYSDTGARLAEGRVVRLAPQMGRRALSIESPTARADVRVREVFVELPASARLVPGQRVWGHTPRPAASNGARTPVEARR